MEKWTRLSKELLLKTRILEFYRGRFRSPSGQKEGDFDILECDDWINVIPVTPDGQVVFVRQYRFGTDEITLEFPAGKVDVGESPLQTARRELKEEVGLVSGRVEQIGVCHPNPAIQSNRAWSFVCHDAVIGAPQQLDEYEEIEIELIPLDSIEQKIASGEIGHALTIVTWYFYKTAVGKF